MYADHARAMIESNERGLRVLEAIAARSPSAALDRAIAARREIISSQREPSRFSPAGALYFPGAETADAGEVATQASECFGRAASQRVAQMAERIRMVVEKQMKPFCVGAA